MYLPFSEKTWYHCLPNVHIPGDCTRFALFLLATVTTLSAADTITLRADLYPPINGDPKSTSPGAMIEIAQQIFPPAGYSIDYQIMPWSRTIDEVKAGRIDGAVAAEPAGSPDLAFPSESQGYWAPILCTPAKSTWSYSGPNSLSGLSIGTILDYDYGKDEAGNSYSAWFTAHPEKYRY